jgi:glutathione S-transferase
MSEFIVHSLAGSPFGRSVLATLEEKGAHYRMVPVATGGLKTEPHISRHPFGRIPVLEHDGFLLYETQAILRYLDRVIPAPSLTPAEARVAARMDQVMNVSDWYLFQGVGNVILFQRIIGPRLLGLPTDLEAINSVMPKAHTVFDELARLLAGQDYLAGNCLTLADLQVAPLMDMFRITPEWAPLTARHANLVQWLARIMSRASMQATTWERVAAMAQAA